MKAFRVLGWVAGIIVILVGGVAVSTLVVPRLAERDARAKIISKQTFVVLAGDSSKCLVGAPPPKREGLDLPAAALDVAKVVVKRGANVSADYLLAAAKDTSSPVKIVEMPVYLYSDLNTVSSVPIPTGLECLVIANGHVGFFDPDHPPPILTDPARIQASDPQGLFGSSSQDGKPFYALRNLHFDDFPLSYLEFRLVPDASHQFFKFEPSVLYFRDSIASLVGDGRKQIELTVSVQLPTSTGLPADASDQDTAVLQTTITITDMQTGSVAGVLQADGTNNFSTQTRWFPLSNLPSFEDVEKIRSKTDGKSLSFGPANLRVTYKESEKPDLLLQYMARALSDPVDKEAKINSAGR